MGSRHWLVITAGLHYNGLEQVIGGGVGRALKVDDIGRRSPEVGCGGAAGCGGMTSLVLAAREDN